MALTEKAVATRKPGSGHYTW